MALLMIIERDIEELNSFEKFEYFINLLSFYHLNNVGMVSSAVICLGQLKELEKRFLEILSIWT